MPPSLFIAQLLGLAASALAGTSYPWHKRGANNLGGSVDFVAPSNFSEPPTWVWPNLDDELHRHGPVLDADLNLYVATSAGFIRKFTSSGKPLWEHRFSIFEGKVLTSPYLHEGKLYITSTGRSFFAPSQVDEHWVWCLDMETGKVLWKAPGPPGPVNQDSHTVHVSPEGVILAPMIDPVRHGAKGDGNNKIYAMNSTDGKLLWDYVLEQGVVWNFMPSTPGDGTFYFSTTCGVARRLRLHDASLVWQGDVAEPGGMHCGTGGGVLGPNGIFYAEANWVVGENPETRKPGPKGVSVCAPGYYCPDGFGLLVAHDAESGETLWARRFGGNFGGMQYPTVGKLGGKLAVVAAIGSNPSLPEPLMGPKYLPFWVRVFMQKFQVHSYYLRRLLGVPYKENGVVAYDAATGELLWRWEEEPWEHFAGKGDEATFHDRMTRSFLDHRLECICGPDNWGIPAIGGDGTVYVASGNTGKMYAIRDDNGNAIIEPSEVSTFETESGFLQGPALGPGILAAAPCWGPFYVWKSS